LDRKIVGKRFVSWSEARSIMEERIKQGSPSILPEQERTWEYLKTVGNRDPERDREAINKLIELGLNEITAVNMVNICPREPGEVRLVLQLEKDKVYDEDLINKILDILNECAG